MKPPAIWRVFAIALLWLLFPVLILPAMIVSAAARAAWRELCWLDLRMELRAWLGATALADEWRAWVTCLRDRGALFAWWRRIWSR